jgi:hypothetical protein
LDSETKPCSACAKPLPLEAAFCSVCGATQTKPEAPLSSSAFPLAMEEADDRPNADAASIAPPAAPPPESAPPSDPMELDVEIELEEISLDDELGLDLGTDADVNVDESEATATEPSPPPPPEAAATATEEDEDAPETSSTVRMSMSDVAKVWNEEANPDGEEETDAAPGGAKVDGGLPKGFMLALIASMAIVATLVYLLS